MAGSSPAMTRQNVSWFGWRRFFVPAVILVRGGRSGGQGRCVSIGAQRLALEGRFARRENLGAGRLSLVKRWIAASRFALLAMTNF